MDRGHSSELYNTKFMIKALQHCFTTHGYPQVIISDNGSVFTSKDFTFFFKSNLHLITLQRMCRQSSKDIQNNGEKAEIE